MHSNLTSIFFTVVIAHFLALLSPGPDFILVIKSGVNNKKQHAIGIAIGIAIANAFYITLCLIGVGSILASSIIIMTTLKIAGGMFLTYLGVKTIMAKKADYAFLNDSINSKVNSNSSIYKEFITGFSSSILNPKLPLFYLSLFTLVLNNEVGLWFKILLGIWMSLLVFIWDSFIIFILSRKNVRAVFNKISYYTDKITGTILGLIGLKIITSAVFDDNK